MHVNVDSLLVDKMVNEVKSAGVFDQFRKDSMADVDTKPAYQNLRQRVELTVSKFLAEQTWRQDLNKNQLREKLRKHITEAGFLDTGVERIVDQVVNPKISTFFQPKIEDIAYKYLGIEKPHSSPPRPQSCNGSLDIKVDLLPTDLEAVSPDSEKTNPKSETKENMFNDSTEDKNEEFESPPFEPIEGCVQSPVKKEDSNHSHLSGISGLTSQDSVSSEHKATTPPLHKFTVSADTQPESELSEVSSNSRLSIVTNEESSSKPAVSEPVDNVGISEEAQMPKFNDSYSSGESKVVHNLHFDIKREDIKFEGTDRNADKHLYESDHSNENNLKMEEIKSNVPYIVKSEFQIKPEIVNNEFKIEPTIKAEEALGESISTKASSSFEENNESTAVDMDLGGSDSSQSTNSSGLKYNDNATEMKSEGRTNGDSGPRPPSPPPPNDYFLTKPPSPPALETNAPLEPPSLTLADLYRIPPTHLKEYLPPRPPSPVNEYLPPRPPSPANKYLQPRPPTPPYEQMNYFAPAVVNSPKPPSPMNPDVTLKPPSPPSPPSPPPPPKQQEEDCKPSLHIPNSHKDINLAESEISHHATVPKAPSTPPLPKSNSVPTKDTVFTESETSQSTNSSEPKNKESSPTLKSDESTKIVDIQPPKPPSTPPLPSKSSSRNESRSKSSSHHHHHHKSKSSRDSSRSSNGNSLHRSSSSSSRNHSSPSSSSRTDDKNRSSSSNRHKSSSKSDKDKDKSRDKKKDDHTSARHKERRRKSTDSNDGDSHRQSSRNNSHHGDERSNTLKETPTNSNSSGMSSNTNSNSGTSCNDASQKRSTSGSSRKTKSSYRSPNREDSFKYFTIERTEREAVQRLLGKLKDVIKRNQPPIYLLDCGHDTRKSFENLCSKVIAIDGTNDDNLASPKKGPIVIAMDSEMKQTESMEFSIKPHDRSMPVDNDASKNNSSRTKSRKRKPDESYTVSYHMFTGNGREKELIIDCLEYNKANKMFRPNNDRIEVSPTSSELSVSSKENEFTDKTKNSSPENPKNGKHIKAEGIVRIEKPSSNGFKVSSQRYSSEDLYKPRPLSQRPRRREMMETEII